MKYLKNVLSFYRPSPLGWILMAVILVDRVIVLGLMGIPVAMFFIFILTILSIIMNELQGTRQRMQTAPQTKQKTKGIK